jgi:hypothetical protein
MRFLSKIDAVLDLPVDKIIRHLEHRLFELAMAVTMIGVGLFLMLSPGSVASSELRYLLDVMSVETCSTLFFVAGIARIVALALNGHWMPAGAYIRAAGAAVGAVLWSQWGAALYQLHLLGAPISPDLIVYSGLALFEVVSARRALRGAVSSERNHQQGMGHDQQAAAYPVASPDFLYRYSDPAAALRSESRQSRQAGSAPGSSRA